MDNQARLDYLEASRARGCQRCSLRRGRNQLVFGVGNPDADIVLVGEGPGEDENRDGTPFVGAAGQLLDGFLRRLSLSRDQETGVYIANVVKCRPSQNRNPDSLEIAACMPFLHLQLRIIRPKVIVALGRVAAESLSGKTSPVRELREATLTYRNETTGLCCPLIATYHPSYILRCQGRDLAEAKQAAGSVLTDLTSAVEFTRST